MKKFIFLTAFFFVFALFAQEAQPEENESEAPAEETAEAAQNQQEAAPAKADDDKITVSKEELAKLVREAVAEEMAKKEAEKKEAEAQKSEETVTAQAETKPAEGEKTDEAAAKKEIHGTEDTNGLIQTSYTKSSIAFIMGDDNLRDNSQYSPKWDIGSRYEYEDFADRIYGYSNNVKSSTKLSLFHEEKGFLPYLTARMSLSFAMYNSVDAMSDKLITSLKEDRSFLEIDFRHPTKHRFNITLYPYNADNIAIGTLRGLRWGGNASVWPQSDSSPVPGFQVLYGYSDFSIYFGFKAHAQSKTDKLSTEIVPKETVYGFFGGLTYNNKELGLKASLQGAYIDKGDNVNISDYMLKKPGDDTIKSYGIDAYLEYNNGSRFGDPIGINSYSDGTWIRPDYTTDISWRIRGEYLFQNERLQNADYLSSAKGEAKPITDDYFAHGAAVDLGFRWKGLRAMFLYSYRDLSFMTFDAPGVNPWTTIPSEAKQTPEHLFTVSADYFVWNFWFGASFGYKIPATYTVKDENGRKNTMVIRERLSTDAVSTAFDRTREMLPTGRDALDIFFVKADIKYQFSDSFTAMLEYSFTRDHNRQRMVAQDDGTYKSESDVIEVMDVHGLMFLVEGRF
ncbi:hypothetical protein IKO70_00690 [bacterium]|nr:hypothetical protein [bacterium]